MKLNEAMVELICNLEEEIGSHCYNPRSYNGWTGDVGCSFRYPVCYSDKDGTEYKTDIFPCVTEENVHTLKY